MDCQDLEIENIFSDEEFIALNKSNVPLDIFRYIRITSYFRSLTKTSCGYRLNNNELTTITPFPSLSIKVLNLHRNKITKIDRWAFYNLTLLEELDLSSNALTAKTLLPEIFEGHYSPSLFEPMQNLKVTF